MTLRSRWFVLCTGIAILIALSIAACGGDDDDDSGDNGGGATATATSGDGAGNGTPGGNTDPFADLDRLTQGLDNATGKTSYTITTADGESSYSVYSDGTRSRFDVTDANGVTNTTINKDGETIVCDSGSEMCFSSEVALDGTGLLNVFASFLSSGTIGAAVAQAQAAGADIETSSEEYAGTDAACYTWSDSADGETYDGKVCFADNGVLLYEKLASGSQIFTIEATEFSEEVSDSDFEPPYDVQ